MGAIVVLVLLFLLPIVGLLAWFVLSSCLGDNVRARVAAVDFDPRRGAYGRSYARGIGFGMGPATSEQIEMEDVIAKSWDEREAED
ncbi:hypothetical protein AAFC00_001959 [Neodothiora populina]|uniref:Uncharacterized protein n=1 Tax=Neodothiora populina TaxID=2781224 RepID=A0ABR3PR30_9PEZI